MYTTMAYISKGTFVLSNTGKACYFSSKFVPAWTYNLNESASLSLNSRGHVYRISILQDQFEPFTVPSPHSQ